MKNVIIALGLTLATSTAAFAQGSALDAQFLPQDLAASNAQATISTSYDTNEVASFSRFGDHAPVLVEPAAGSIDYTATASIGDSPVNITTQPRLGDGVLAY